MQCRLSASLLFNTLILSSLLDIMKIAINSYLSMTISLMEVLEITYMVISLSLSLSPLTPPPFPFLSAKLFFR